MASSETLTVANDLSSVGRLLNAVEALCRARGIGEPDLAAFELAIEELATNVVMHGYRDGVQHEFTVRIDFEGELLRAVITDKAPAFDPFARSEVDTTLPLGARPIGGLGVHLVRKMMDRSTYERRDDCNVVTVERRLLTPEGV